MGRGLNQATIDELAKISFSPVIIVELETFNRSLSQTQFVRAWSGIGNLTFQSNTFTGVGDLGGIESIGEENDIKALPLRLSLSGVPSNLISTVLGNEYRNRPGKIWLALMNDSGAIIGAAVPFTGKIASMFIERGGEKARIVVEMENALADLERPRERRYTDEDQKELFPGDKGLEFVAGLQNKEVVWKG